MEPVASFQTVRWIELTDEVKQRRAPGILTGAHSQMRGSDHQAEQQATLENLSINAVGLLQGIRRGDLSQCGRQIGGNGTH